MSAGFSIAEQVFWGSNGAIEAYTEALAKQSALHFGPDDPLARFFRQTREAFNMGAVVSLDEWLLNDASRKRMLTALDAATEELLHEDVFTRYGIEWVEKVMTEVRSAIAEAPGAPDGARER